MKFVTFLTSPKKKSYDIWTKQKNLKLASFYFV